MHGGGSRFQELKIERDVLPRQLRPRSRCTSLALNYPEFVQARLLGSGVNDFPSKSRIPVGAAEILHG